MSSEIFQGYKVFVRRAGSSEVNIITINACVTFASLLGLKSLVTYNISVAVYTFAGVGKESEMISVTTTLGKATQVLIMHYWKQQTCPLCITEGPRYVYTYI